MTRCSALATRALCTCLCCRGGGCCCRRRKCDVRPSSLSPSADLCRRVTVRIALCACLAAGLAYGPLRPAATESPPELRPDGAPARVQFGRRDGGNASLLDPGATAAAAAAAAFSRLPQPSRIRQLALFQPLSLVRCLAKSGEPLNNATVTSAAECPDQPSPSSNYSVAAESSTNWQSNASASEQEQLRPRGLSDDGPADARRRRFVEYSFVGCLSQPPARVWQRRTRRLRSMTVQRCTVDCYDAGFNYALLMLGDTCLCLVSSAEAVNISHGDRCMQPCSGNATEACGGATAASVYHLRSPDGSSDWSPWMSPPWRSPGSVHATRLRHCLLSRDDKGAPATTPADARAPGTPTTATTAGPPLTRECQANLQRRWDRSVPAPPAFDRFVGCFVFGSWPSVAAERRFEGTAGSDPQSCVSFCSQGGGGDDTKDATVAGFDYALYAGAERRCLCTLSLGIARPFAHCDGSYESAAAVYVATPPAALSDRRGLDGASVRLRFDPLPVARRVHLLAYFRSGSTFTSELLGRHPGAFYLYEPDAAHGLTWPDVDDSTAAAARAASAMHDDFYRALERYMSCDVYRLPPRWLTLNSRWPHDLELTPRYADYCSCLRIHGADACTAAFRAHCEAASLVAAKTIRVSSAVHAERFALQRPDIAMLHLTRDPRGVLASRKHLHVAITTLRVRQLCGRLSSISAAADRLAALGYTVHNLRYEDAAVAPVATARLVLEQYLGLDMSAALVERLLVITGHLEPPADAEGAAAAGVRAFGTLRRNSRGPLNKWKRLLSAAELRLIALHCANLDDQYLPAGQLFHE